MKSIEVQITIHSCHECPKFRPRWWEWLNPIRILMGFWRASGYCEMGNFYIPCAHYGSIPVMCPLQEDEPRDT